MYSRIRVNLERLSFVQWVSNIVPEKVKMFQRTLAMCSFYFIRKFIWIVTGFENVLVDSWKMFVKRYTRESWKLE